MGAVFARRTGEPWWEEAYGGRRAQAPAVEKTAIDKGKIREGQDTGTCATGVRRHDHGTSWGRTWGRGRGARGRGVAEGETVEDGGKAGSKWGRVVW